MKQKQKVSNGCNLETRSIASFFAPIENTKLFDSTVRLNSYFFSTVSAPIELLFQESSVS